MGVYEWSVMIKGYKHRTEPIFSLIIAITKFLNLIGYQLP